MDIHVFPIPIPPPTSLSTRPLWVFPVHQVRAPISCIQPGLVICFTLDNKHDSMLFSKIKNASRICVSSLRRGHANLLCILPILVYVLPKRAPQLTFLWLCWVFVAVRGLFCSCREQGLLCSWGVWASRCSGLSCCRAQALGAQA